MKICPICKATCFDDMETCYGCMHRFIPQDRDEQEREACGPKERNPLEEDEFDLEEPRVDSAQEKAVPLAACAMEAQERPSSPSEDAVLLSPGNGYRLVITFEPAAAQQAALSTKGER